MEKRYKLLIELLRDEVSRLGGLCYFDKPYLCCSQEALGYFDKILYPHNRIEILRDDKSTVISIKPIKGSRKRKPMIIKMWWNQ